MKVHIEWVLRPFDLRGVSLREELSHAHYSEILHKGGSLRLRGCDLTGADLRRVDLAGASLQNADLTDANLARVNLERANLGGAILQWSDLTRANLRGVSCDGAVLAGTRLLDVDLESLCTARDVVHRAPSFVDHQAVAKSLRVAELLPFLADTGMPLVVAQYLIDSLRSLDPLELFTLMRSTFISHGGPDAAFAKRLRDALHRHGVTTFLFSQDAVPGQKLHRTMREGVNNHDRVILICSKRALKRLGVLNEIEQTLAREARDGGEAYLVPVTLDDYVFKRWKPERMDLRQEILDRVVADFRATDGDSVEAQARFDTQLASLLKALRR